MEKLTESPSPYRHLESWSAGEILRAMNTEDLTVPLAVGKAIPQIEALVEVAVASLERGGRLFYIGAGTSGRLGILDASECPPTFGVPDTWVTGLIAGGDRAIRKAVEGAEDSETQAWEDLSRAGISQGDIVVGIAASGTTPYVVHGLLACTAQGIATGCVTCNPGSPVAKAATFPIEVITGPEFLTGSTRLKAGTAQKLVLNMISTATMIRLGRVMDNRMVDMQLTNAKLVARGAAILMEELDLPEEVARRELLEAGSVRAVIDARRSA